jgi:GR25 family glycosyltransferase involved in LPS biosynthesis
LTSSEIKATGIGPIVVINLDRQKSRWKDIIRELNHITDAVGVPLSDRVVRYSAFDARVDAPVFFDNAIIDPYYSLSDQLYVEPQPDAHIDAFDLDRPIRMSQAEVAVACSHIAVWRNIAQSNASHTLVLEDDVWFDHRFGRVLEQAWREIEEASNDELSFDILYLSYKEVRHGAPKELLSKNLFRPERGLWYMSGYVLSKKGALALLDLLPCRGPIDLWVNHKFRGLEVRALRRSLINQRRDLHSTNSYSVLPALVRMGILNSGDSSLFHQRPLHSPVFAFGDPGTGLSSLAVALSMLGYRCCSDFDSIPDIELEDLLSGQRNRIFDAYVNIGSLTSQIRVLRQRYPRAKYIVIKDERVGPTVSDSSIATDALAGADVLHLQRKHANSWGKLCQHLKMAPPDAHYPAVDDIGLRYRQSAPDWEVTSSARRLRHDPSPWIAKARSGWAGISVKSDKAADLSDSFPETVVDDLTQIHPKRWLLRHDTFPGNLGLFRPENVAFAANGGLSLSVANEPLGVRNFSAAAVSSRTSFLFGRFEATLQATNVPGIVTGFFLHRDSPRQEIDIEILGNKPDELLVNVFYNPGSDGAKFDYGYRGTPAAIKLGFDASKAPHHYAIEWNSCEIRWFVDQRLVHCRTIWDPTPIPHLPMKLHVNTWPTRSRELGGRLALHALPASAFLRRIVICAYDIGGRIQSSPPSSATQVCSTQAVDSAEPTAMAGSGSPI